jgi:Bacterial lectin
MLAGTIVYAHSILLGGTFKVSFQIQLGDGDGGGFMVQPTGATAVGTNGGGLGMNGLGGFAVELDTWQNGCDPDDDHVGVDTLTTTCGSEAGTLPSLVAQPLSSLGIQLHDGQWHQIDVAVLNFSVTVLVDGTTALSGIAVPPIPATTPVWFGFAGSTGQAIAAQQIRNVTIAFPGPTCL